MRCEYDCGVAKKPPMSVITRVKSTGLARRQLGSAKASVSASTDRAAPSKAVSSSAARQMASHGGVPGGVLTDATDEWAPFRLVSWSWQQLGFVSLERQPVPAAGLGVQAAL